MTGCGGDTVSPADNTTWWANQSPAADAPLPLHTFPALGHALLVRVYVVLGPVGHCCYVLVAKSSKEPVSQPNSVKHNPMVSTKCYLGQPPSFFLENGMYEYGS